jgi:hypothetical protein
MAGQCAGPGNARNRSDQSSVVNIQPSGQSAVVAAGKLIDSEESVGESFRGLTVRGTSYVQR